MELTQFEFTAILVWGAATATVVVASIADSLLRRRSAEMDG